MTLTLSYSIVNIQIFRLGEIRSHMIENIVMSTLICLFVLRFYDPVNPMGSCPAWSVYLTTRLLCRLSPLTG